MLEPPQLDGTGERIAGDRIIVVPEDDVRVRQPREQREQPPLAARAREQIAGDAHEVGPALHHPLDGPLDRAYTAGRHAEVEVGKVRDAKAVQLGRQAGDPEVADAEPHPPRLEPPPHHARRYDGRDDERGGSQISSFSRTGLTDTT